MLKIFILVMLSGGNPHQPLHERNWQTDRNELVTVLPKQIIVKSFGIFESL